MDTQCPYCSQTITVPSTVTLKPNVAKCSTRQFIGFLKSHPAVWISGIVAILIGGGFVWWFYEKECEEDSCLGVMAVHAASHAWIDPEPLYREHCPSSGKEYVYHIGKSTYWYETNPGAVIVECPVYKKYVISTNAETPKFVTTTKFNRSLPTENNQPIRITSLAFLNRFTEYDNTVTLIFQVMSEP